MKRRAFTYKERAFNALGRTGLLEQFKEKINPDKVRRLMLEKGQTVSLQDARAIALAVEEKIWEEDKEITTGFIDLIIKYTKVYDITNIEAYAFVSHLFSAMEGNKEMSETKVRKILDKAEPTINQLRIENWDEFMKIL